MQGLRLPLGKPKRLREKHKSGTGPRKAPGLQGRSRMGPETPPRPGERGVGQYLMLALMPQALCREVIDSQRAVQVAHSSQWHPAERGTGVTQGWKCMKDQG